MNREVKKRKKIRFKINRLTQGLMPGQFKSETTSSKGGGIVVTKKKFVPGKDPVPAYDWKTMFRARPEVFHREKKRHTDLVIVADVSKSMFFTSEPDRPKIDIVGLFFGIAYDFAGKGNLSGALYFDSEAGKFQSPHGPAGIQAMMEELENCDFSKKSSFLPTNLQPALLQLERLLVKRSLIFIVSDFNFETNYCHELRRLKDYHDVVPVVVNDQMDEISPIRGAFFTVRDMETGEISCFRQIQKDKSFLEIFKQCGLDYIDISTKDDDASACLKVNQFFGKRRF